MRAAVAELDKWHKTRQGYMVFGAVELLLSYALISRAIDTGSWWQYSFGVVFLVGAAQNYIKAIWFKRHGKK